MVDVGSSLLDWRELARTVSDGVAVQDGGSFAFVSERFASIASGEPDEITGSSWRSLFDDEEADRLEREAFGRVRTDDRWNGESRLAGQGETLIDLTLSASPDDEDAVLWVISERQVDRTQELERYETIVDTVTDGIYALDENLQFTFVNDQFCETAELPREQLLGMRATRLFPHDDESDWAETRRAVLDEESNEGIIEGTLPTSDGDRIVESRYRLHPEPDGEFRGSVGVLRDLTELKERQEKLERQRDELLALDRLTELLLQTTRELVQSSSRDAVERSVCEQLEESDRYRFAWIGEREVESGRVVSRAAAGEDDTAVDRRTHSVDGTAVQSPTSRAIRTGEIQVADGDSHAHASRTPEELEVESVATVPLRHDGTVYGVLEVHTDRPDAFHERERAGLDTLGRTIGFVIFASRNQDLLLADSVVGLEFDISDIDSPIVDVAVDRECEFELDGYVKSGDQWNLYVSVADAAPSELITAITERPPFERGRVITATDDGGRIELIASELPILSTVTAAGATVREATIGPEDARAVLEAPAGQDVREVVTVLKSGFPDVGFLARRQYDRERTTVSRSGGVLAELTDRQREVLTAAYQAGYFAWPRDSTAEEVADSVGIARPTLQAHLRKAEAHILSALLD